MTRSRPSVLRVLVALAGCALVAAACGAGEAGADREVVLESGPGEPAGTAAPTSTRPLPTEAPMELSATGPSTSGSPSTEPATSGPAATVAASSTTATPSTSAPPSTVDAAVTTTSVVVPAVTTTEPPPTRDCLPVPAIPPDAIDVETVVANIDLDDEVDLVSTYGLSDRSAWYLSIELGAGGGMRTSLEDALLFDLGFPLIRPIGHLDVDGDGTVELFAVVSAGASSEIVALFDVVGCTVVQVADVVTGAGVQWAIGASVGNSSGIRCADGGIEQMFARSFDGETWEGTITHFSLFGPLMETGAEREGGWATTAEVLSEVVTLDCPGVDWRSVEELAAPGRDG